ncbi:hypothetical protein LIER_17741 [Lithospermum erythrorhizon]|uniref:CBS domain-containing protein n=1 Tax=Lithospermum erythrorhizon TaxID=34254 RepID=A0AAV3QE86_LITER
MQRLVQAFRYCHEQLQPAALQRRIQSIYNPMTREAFPRHSCVISPPYMHQKGLENTTVEDILMNKGEEKVGSWLWCRIDDTAHDAAKQMAKNNIGSLVVLRPGKEEKIAGIITERDYLQKVIAGNRPSKNTRVGDIMTDQDKLITVTSETNILQAMQLMTENHIRHVPVIDGKIVGMISITDVVRAVVGQQSGDMQRMNDFIKGEYY